jgi:hypothetical protein
MDESPQRRPIGSIFLHWIGRKLLDFGHDRQANPSRPRAPRLGSLRARG